MVRLHGARMQRDEWNATLKRTLDGHVQEKSELHERTDDEPGERAEDASVSRIGMPSAIARCPLVGLPQVLFVRGMSYALGLVREEGEAESLGTAPCDHQRVIQGTRRLRVTARRP